MNLTLLRNRNFSLLVFGKFVSVIGTTMQSVALSLYVLALTGSAAQFSILISLNFIPHILFGAIGGVVADQFNKKRILVVCDIVSGLLTLIFLWYTYFYQFEFGLACLLVVSLATVNVFFSPAVDALIPISVGKEQIMEANAINRFIINIGKFVAPLLAGIIYPLVGLVVLLLIDSISFLLSAVSEMFIIPEQKAYKVKSIHIRKIYGDLISGIKYVWHEKSIKYLLGISFVFNLFLYPMFAVMIPFVLKDVMDVTDFQFGLSMSVYTAAIAFAIMFMKKKNEKSFLLRKFNIGTIMLSIITLIIGVIFLNIGSVDVMVSYILLLASNFAFGYFIVYWALPSMSFYHLVTPKDKLGRVMGVQNVNEKTACVLGQLIIGTLTDFYSQGIIVIVSAIILMATALIGYIIIKKEV